MYERSARVYDALLRQKDYAGASGRLRDLLHGIAPQAATLLDVGCGTGRHIEHLRDTFDVQGLDLSPEMLEVAGERCPGVPLHCGDLVDFSLPDRFDVVVCLHGSIGYAGTPERLRQAVATMAHHLNPGGVLVIEPWLTPERFVDDKLVFDRADDPGLKVARIYVQRREGRMSIYDSHYVVGTPAGVTHFIERQELALFTDAEYVDALQRVGLQPLPADVELFGYGLYVARASVSE